MSKFLVGTAIGGVLALIAHRKAMRMLNHLAVAPAVKKPEAK